LQTGRIDAKLNAQIPDQPGRQAGQRMKLIRNEDVEAPVAFVYAALSDFDHWERAAMRRGAEVTRLDTLASPGPGMTWNVGFDFRGRRRIVDLRLAGMEPSQMMAFSGQGTSMNGRALLDLVEMGPKRTRIAFTVEVEARTLAARLLLQSLKFASTRVNRSFQARTAQLAADIEDRFRRGGKR
jgi:carbon monoxide dehydrogenase subunit G